MELNISYNEIMELIKRLPQNEMMRLLNELKSLHLKEENQESPENSLSKKLLQGPVMSEQQFEQFNESRKYFTQWKNL